MEGASGDQGWHRRRMTRAAFVRWSAAGLGTAAFLAACGGGDNNKTSNAPAGGSTSAGGGAAAASTATGAAGGAAQPKRGGTFRMNGATFSDILDPHRSLAGAAGFFALIGEEAFRISADGKQLEPSLVEKYEIPGDGTEIVLHARQGVTWHNRVPTNGRAFTAEDIAYSMMRIAGKFDPQRISSYQRRSTLPNLESVTAVDATTAKVKLSAPHSGLLRGLAHERNYFIPKELVDAQQDKWNDPMTLVGTGPWMFESYQKDVKAVLKPNPTYWEKGKPYLDSIEQFPVADRVSWLSAFSQGKIDLFDNVNKAERDTLSKTYKDAQPVIWPYASWEHLRFNVTRKPFTDPRIRLAMQLVFDYKRWADNFYGDGFWDYTGPLASAFPEAIQAAEVAKLPGYNPATKDADIKKAKDLMTAAGFPDGKLTFKIFTQPGGNGYPWNDYAIAAQDTLKKLWPAMDVGIDLAADSGTFSTRSVQNDFDALVYIIYAAPDPVLDLTDNYHTTGSRNYGKFSDSQIDQLLGKAASQIDTTARATTLKEIQNQLLNNLMPIAIIAQPKQSEYVSAKLRGLENVGRPFGGALRDLTQASKNYWWDKA